MAYKYCVKENWGKSFFTHEERKQMYLSGHPGNVWVVDDNIFGDNWISKVVGTTKTKVEAQAILDGVIEDAQDVWDADNVDGESSAEKIRRLGVKPVKYNLP
mgnify:FL=1|tara:strand:- start:277 stop:582 length:306 start_codon:yes stop_codon:yes gene_type:complete